VCERLPHFHDPHDGSINLVLTVLENPFRSTSVFFNSLAELDLVDLDPNKFVFKSGVELEGIRFLNVFPFWNLQDVVIALRCQVLHKPKKGVYFCDILYNKKMNVDIVYSN